MHVNGSETPSKYGSLVSVGIVAVVLSQMRTFSIDWS